jgi:hypothetical protein
MKPVFPVLTAALMLAACGGQNSPAENVAENLEAAADQSDPAAAGVLDNAADAVRETEGTGVPANPEAMAQNAIEEAGNAQLQSNQQ